MRIVPGTILTASNDYLRSLEKEPRHAQSHFFTTHPSTALRISKIDQLLTHFSDIKSLPFLTKCFQQYHKASSILKPSSLRAVDEPTAPQQSCPSTFSRFWNGTKNMRQKALMLAIRHVGIKVYQHFSQNSVDNEISTDFSKQSLVFMDQFQKEMSRKTFFYLYAYPKKITPLNIAAKNYFHTMPKY